MTGMCSALISIHSLGTSCQAGQHCRVTEETLGRVEGGMAAVAARRVTGEMMIDFAIDLVPQYKFKR